MQKDISIGMEERPFSEIQEKEVKVGAQEISCEVEWREVGEFLDGLPV